MALTFELAQVTVREGEEASLLAERPEMVRALQQASARRRLPPG
jgi:hypothetical protein